MTVKARARMIWAAAIGVIGTTAASGEPHRLLSESQRWAQSIEALPGGGWKLWGSTGKDEGTEIFASSHNVSQVGSIITVWFRWEFYMEQSNAWSAHYHSDVSRREIDCSRQAMRTLSVSYYPENNLGGGDPVSYTTDQKALRWDPLSLALSENH